MTSKCFSGFYVLLSVLQAIYSVYACPSVRPGDVALLPLAGILLRKGNPISEKRTAYAIGMTTR
ncbi:MAG: hypothetical protein QXE12_00625 [Conexivisphaerales archaeon]